MNDTDEKLIGNIRKIIYDAGVEEHNIWILHNRELMPLYEPDSERQDKVVIAGENFKKVTMYFDRKYDDIPDEYKRELKASTNQMYDIMMGLNLDEKLGLSTDEVKDVLAKSEFSRRKSWFDYEQGNEKATFSRDSYEKYWKEEMQTPFSDLSLGLQYWDLDEVRKRFMFIYEACVKNKMTDGQEDYIVTILSQLNQMMEVRNPDPSKGGSYDMYNKFESDLIIYDESKSIKR